MINLNVFVDGIWSLSLSIQTELNTVNYTGHQKV